MCSLNFFEKLNGESGTELEQSNFVLNLATKKHKLSVKGETYLLITFTDSFSGDKIEIPQKFLVIEDLQYTIFIGSIFLRSEYVYVTTRHEIIIARDPAVKFSTTRLAKSNKYMIIPFLSTKKDEQEKRSREAYLAECTTSKEPQFFDDVGLDENSKEFKELKEKIDHYDTDPEQRQALIKQAKEKGIVEIPISTFIQENSKLDSYGLQDFEDTFTDVQGMLKHVKMEHLSKESQEIITECLKDNFDCIARNVWDVRGYVKHTEATIELNSNKIAHQKFVPIPKPLEPHVKKIIDKLEANDVIRKADENDPWTFLHNLIVTQRGTNSSKTRFCIDNRISNAAIKSLNFDYISSMEFLHNLKHSVKSLSLIDLKNSFFSIKIKRSDQYILSFLDSRRQRYCYKRLGQGCKTSPMWLSMAVAKSLKSFQNCCSYMDDIVIFSTEGK